MVVLYSVKLCSIKQWNDSTAAGAGPDPDLGLPTAGQDEGTLPAIRAWRGMMQISVKKKTRPYSKMILVTPQADFQPDEVIETCTQAIDNATDELRKLNLEVGRGRAIVSRQSRTGLTVLDLQQPRDSLPGIQGMQAPI